MFDLTTKAHPCNPEWDHVAKCGAYLAVKCPAHPSAWTNGYIYLHRVVMEMKLGRLLTDTEVVHHEDENGHNNAPDNLELKATQSDHARSHSKPRQSPLSFICAECGVAFSRDYNQRPSVRSYTNTFCSRRCNGKFQRRKQLLNAPVGQLDRPGDS